MTDLKQFDDALNRLDDELHGVNYELYAYLHDVISVAANHIKELEAQLTDAQDFAKRCADSPVGQMVAKIEELEAKVEEEQLARRNYIPVAQANKDIAKAVELGEALLRKRIKELEKETRFNAEHNLDLKKQNRHLAVDRLADAKRIAELEANVTEIPTICRKYEQRIKELEAFKKEVNRISKDSTLSWQNEHIAIARLLMEDKP